MRYAASEEIMAGYSEDTVRALEMVGYGALESPGGHQGPHGAYEQI